MDYSTWKEFLTQWSEELLNFDNHEEWPYFCTDFTPEEFESGWIGFDGATEEQINQAETRLSTKLPPSYREFLKVSNGWRWTAPGMEKVWPVEEIDWFRVRNQPLIDIILEYTYSVSDEEYFVYGANQLPGYRVEYLPSQLEIAIGDDSTFYLLNPRVIFPDGEWEAWLYSAEGPVRYRSFWELMQAERVWFDWPVENIRVSGWAGD